MTTIGELWRRMVHVVRGQSASDDLREEMQLHVELRAGKNRGTGMSDADAMASARGHFGNDGVIRERSGDQWGVR